MSSDFPANEKQGVADGDEGSIRVNQCTSSMHIESVSTRMSSSSSLVINICQFDTELQVCYGSLGLKFD